MKKSIPRLALALGTVLVAIMLFIGLGLNPKALNGADYLERQQAMIRMLNVPMPLLGAATILLTLISAALERSNPKACLALVTAAVLFAAAGFITRFYNQPINALVMTWRPETFPIDWASWRDEWWRWHIARTILAVAALAVFVIGYRRRAEVPTT